MKKQTPGFYVRIKENYYMRDVYRLEYFETQKLAEQFITTQNGECTIVHISAGIIPVVRDDDDQDV